ncbi:RNA polymerase sigma factor [Stieleria varia]|uniref:RNA polymerase sigma factor n=1 Tax=Stieleria varia TaxID=2528005 RepID=A0A5C6AWN9_9BACT|nr:sigma-70 family RNA polymerase sigma factor [Stieleria varia]TWU04435.1 RNA polymerase sigma factor [Stieleria varia]
MITPLDLAETWDRHASRVLLIARSIGEPADDAVQEAFIALASQPHMPDDPLAWLVRVARNQLLMWRRSNLRRQRRESECVSANWFAANANLIDTAIDAQQVTEALLKLPSPTREIIVMHLWGDMSFESIAEITETSKATAHRAFQQGLKTLKQQFSVRDQIEHNVQLPSETCHE